jgi:hypothetical protein
MNLFLLPETRLNEMPSILSGAMVEVNAEPLNDKLMQRGVRVFRCTSKTDGVFALVECGPGPTNESCVNVLSPWQGLWKMRAGNRLIRRIEASLVEAGALMNPKKVNQGTHEQ